MAHHRLLHDNPAAIFSPSVARIAASTARDWAYVDRWLASKLAPPPFERNQDTLAALLALAAANEAADDQRRLLARAEAAALQDLADPDPDPDPDPGPDDDDDSQPPALGPLPPAKDALLDALEHSLHKEGAAALHVLARMAAEAGMAYPDPEQLARAMVRLQGAIYETGQMTARVEVLERQVQRDAAAAAELLAVLQGDDYRPPPDLAKRNLEAQRKIKAMAAQLSDLHDIAVLATSTDTSHPTLHDIVRVEQDYLGLLVRKRDLDAQMAAFAGLPSDPDMARAELDALRRQLRAITTKRDAEFERLVERESPVKRQ